MKEFSQFQTLKNFNLEAEHNAIKHSSLKKVVTKGAFHKTLKFENTVL